MKVNVKKMLCAALAALMVCSSFVGCSSKAPEESELDLHVGQVEYAQTTVAPTETAAKEMSISDLLKEVNGLKDDLETIMDDIEAEDITAAENKVRGLTQKTAGIRNSLNATITNLGDSMPSLTKELENIQGVLDLVDTMAEEILAPLVELFREQPFSGFQTGEGVNTKLLCEYLDFAEQLMPGIEELVEQATTVDLSLVDSDGDINGYLDTIDGLLEMYHRDETVFDSLKAMFGSTEDRVYVIAAQNSSEIRASGGFPGAVGVIRITDGVLTLQDFEPVYDMMSSYTPSVANVTREENLLFHGGLTVPRDADFCPDFERVAYIWSLGYEADQGETVDGVISMTPVVVQKLLALLDEEIKLYDGTVMNGENATKVLQYDLYYKYYGSNVQQVQGRDTYVNQLFADAAKKTLNMVMDNLSFSDFSSYLEIISKCVNDRTFMLWMKDESEQNIIRAVGWNGGLNTDPENPQAGIYYSLTDASKMGWFLNIDVSVGERVLNAEGSYTYPMTVTFCNVISQEEIRSAGRYILGRNSGPAVGSAYFFAPAGGTVSDFVADNGIAIQKHTYNGLELGYMPSFFTNPGKLVTVTYNLTTVPGVEDSLELSMTPTLQDYH